MSELAERQAWLVASLIAGAEPPAGFDPASLRAAREALLRKRASLVAHAWPQLAGSLAERWPDEFLGWARAGRPPAGAVRDGWDFARTLAAAQSLPSAGTVELAVQRDVALPPDRPAPAPPRPPLAGSPADCCSRSPAARSPYGGRSDGDERLGRRAVASRATVKTCG